MADEIKLKAPTVEQQVVVNINGEEKLRSFADTLDKISNNKNLQKYWKTEQELINATTDAYDIFQKKASKDNATELIKVTNALKAVSSTDLSNILPDFDKISKAMAEAQKLVGNIDSAFSVKGFKEAFESFETLKAYSEDIEKIFSHFSVSSDVSELQNTVRVLESEVEKLTRKLTSARNINEELRNEFENYKTGSGLADTLDELDNLKYEVSNLREQAEETFNQFLKLNNITKDGYDREGFYNDNRFKEYFQNIQSGYYTASDAIRQFKAEYAYLLEEGFKSNNDTFGLEQLQAFSNKLDSIFRQVEETSTKINDIISNGVITKSVENLSMDSSLSDSQRSLFGNLLQDEESLKSITSLFQKLVEESNKTSKVDLFNDEQLQKVLSIFDKIENHLSSLRSIISDVGDGEEFSPLLKTINDVQRVVSNLETTVSKIELNVNIKTKGSDEQLLAEIEQRKQILLNAYRDQFNAMKKVKPSGADVINSFGLASKSGSTIAAINKSINMFDESEIENIDQKISAYEDMIKKMKRLSELSYGTNIYDNMDKTFQNKVSSAKGSLTKAINSLDNGASDGLEGLFGQTDLSGVISQLEQIVKKLEEISSSATEFKNIFKEGFNVTASVEEIDKLTDRVKELEDELAKIKLNPVDINKQNISSGTQIEDVFQGGTTSAEKLEEEIKNIDSATEKASESAKEYRKILSQVGEFDVDSKVSAIYKRNDGQLESWTWRAKKDDEGNVLYDQNGKIDYDEPTITVISKYEQLEKIIVKADNELRNLQKDLAEIKAYDPTASTTNIETKISDQKEYIRLLEQTVKVISQSDEYLLDEQQIIEARNKAAREYALTTGAKQEKTDAKQSASDEKKRLANIEQVNRALNKQQITIDAIEKTYNKTTNPDLDREVSNQQDLAELAQKKLAIQNKINSLQGKERNSANEKEFLELEKLIAEYKELAKYKLKANNPSKQELGGQNLQTLIQVQISNYDKLITKAEKYGDATSDTIEKLKEQRDILSKIGSDGKYSATADQYYASRDTYKVESAALSAFETETRAIEQKTQAVKKLSDELEIYNKQIPKKPVDGKRSDKFEGLVQNYKNAIGEAQKYLDNLGDSPVTEEIKKEWENLIGVIKKVKEEMDSIPTAERGSDALSRGKEIDTITKYLNKFTGISKEAKHELNGLLDQLQSGDPSVNVKKIHERFLELTVAERNAGREARNLFDIFKDKKIYSFLGQAASMFSFYDLINYGREGISTLKEFDDGLTKISYTMDMTKSKLNDLGKSVLEMANDLDSSIDNAMQVSQIYANMNTSAEEIKKLSEPTLILSNLTGFDASTVADDIQAVTQQFEIAAEDSMHIADVYDQISRNISVDYGKGIESIAEAVQVAGSTANQAGLSFEQLAAIVGKTAEKTRLDGSQIGNGLKTIMTRLSKVGELSDEVDPETLSDASESLHEIGIEVYNTDGSFRKFDVIMGELANKWDTLSDAEKSNISFSIAATRQTNLLSSILSNFSDSMSMAEEATNANGNALENNQKWVDSFSGRLQALENTAKSAWINILDSETLATGIDLLNGLLKVSTEIINTFGAIPTVFTTGGIGAFIANFTWPSMATNNYNLSYSF